MYESIDTQPTVDQPTVDQLSIKCRLRIDRDVNRVLIKICWLSILIKSIDWHSTTDALSTHDLTEFYSNDDDHDADDGD